jgi:CheY-like chemotaxis protein
MIAVLGFNQLLTQEPLSPAQAAMVRHIGEAGDALLRMIDNMLDLLQIEAGQLVIDCRPFEPARLFREIDHRFRRAAEGKGLIWTVDADVENLPAVVGDPHRLEQILINLVDNAIKFTVEGSVGLTARPLLVDDQTVRLRVEVRDTGSGLSEDTLERLFQPFTQGDAGINRQFGGTGLGLAISRRLVERMDGALGVTSQEGQGCTFWFEMPLQRPEARTTPTPAPAPAEAQAAALMLSGLRVLVADDKPINLLVAEKILQRQGAQVVTAVDGQEALDRLKAADEDFDAVLMDIQMPVMDGLTATREIRRDPRFAALPVIALTAGVLPQEREAALAAGMTDFLVKPISMADVTSTLLRLTGGKA